MMTQLRAATAEELERFMREHELKDLDEAPAGSQSMTLGEFIDATLESHRQRQIAER